VTDPGPDARVPGSEDRLPPSAYVRMSLVLRVGLLLSLAVFLGALATYLALHPGAVWISSAPDTWLPYLNARGFFAGLAAGSPEAFLTLGIFLLVATPIARVVSGLYYFERGGERAIAAIALTVLTLLLFGLFVLGPLIR